MTGLQITLKNEIAKRAACAKGQIISECPYEIIVYPKIATKKIPRFLSWPLRRGQIKKIKALYYTN